MQLSGASAPHRQRLHCSRHASLPSVSSAWPGQVLAGRPGQIGEARAARSCRRRGPSSTAVRVLRTSTNPVPSAAKDEATDDMQPDAAAAPAAEKGGSEQDANQQLQSSSVGGPADSRSPPPPTQAAAADALAASQAPVGTSSAGPVPNGSQEGKSTTYSSTLRTVQPAMGRPRDTTASSSDDDELLDAVPPPPPSPQQAPSPVAGTGTTRRGVWTDERSPQARIGASSSGRATAAAAAVAATGDSTSSSTTLKPVGMASQAATTSSGSSKGSPAPSGPPGGSASGSGGTSTTIDEQDTPEALADVESSSVAPDADWFRDKDDLLTISSAVTVGAVVAGSVFAFDVAIQFIHDLPDIFSTNLGIGGGRATGFVFGDVAIPFRCIMPIGAGVLVAGLTSAGFSPPLKQLTRAIEGVVDDRKSYKLPRSYGPVFRKAAASAITLGSGASLGPEAPSVELGANTAAVIAPRQLSKRRKRMLVAAGAAAGVTAAFDAPVAGALFAIEFVLKSSRLGLDRLSTSTVFVAVAVAAGVENVLRTQGQILGLKGAASHLVGRIPYFSINSNLIVDVLQFSALGLGCAGAAVLLYEGVRVSEIALRPLPRIVSAPLAGALCGAIALRFPQVQYGYVNLEEIFRDSTQMSLSSLFSLLVAKVAATAVCVGGGLVGGLFAPSLFLGALVGDIMGHVFSAGVPVVDNTTYVVVGAAAVLGAACRAPLTAMALMVEITRDTGLLVPLLAAIGMSSLVTDYLEGAFSRQLEGLLIEMYLKEKAMFWGAAAAEQLIAAGGSGGGQEDSVESVMGTTTNMYVRHTLPLEQARTAMMGKATKAAVVVDDNFKVMGVVYLPEIEDEIVRRRELTAPDSNFNRPS